MQHAGLAEATAYDKARKEYYRFRHSKEVAVRVAREEALAVGAYFGLGPLEIGMKLEDQSYENWKSWAIAQAEVIKAARNSSMVGAEDLEEVGEDSALAPTPAA